MHTAHGYSMLGPHGPPPLRKITPGRGPGVKTGASCYPHQPLGGTHASVSGEEAHFQT